MKKVLITIIMNLLKILELDKFLDNSDRNIRESLYNYTDTNKQAVKDLNSIMVLFDFYSVFDNVLINYNEQDISWELLILKSADLNHLIGILYIFLKSMI